MKKKIFILLPIVIVSVFCIWFFAKPEKSYIVVSSEIQKDISYERDGIRHKWVKVRFIAKNRSNISILPLVVIHYFRGSFETIKDLEYFNNEIVSIRKKLIIIMQENSFSAGIRKLVQKNPKKLKLEKKILI